MALYNADLNVSGTLTVPSGIFSDSVTVSGASILTSDSDVGGGSALTVKEVDGAPSVANVDTIVVSDGTLTDDGGGQVTITISGGGGGGSTANALVGSDGITVTSGDPTDTISGFRTEFVNASGSLASQITADIANHDAIADAHHTKYTDGEAIAALEPTTSALAASGVATDATVTTNRTEFVNASGSLQSSIDSIDSSVTLQEAYDNGDGIIIADVAKPFQVTGSGIITSDLDVQGVLTVPDGSDSAPSISFASTPNAGFYLASSTDIHAVLNGFIYMHISTDGLNIPLTPIYVKAGTAATPGYSFWGDPNTGMYNIAGDTIGFTAGGTKRLTISGAGDDSDGIIVADMLTVVGDTNLANTFFTNSSTGRVGIGITNPVGNLHIVANPANLRLEDTDGAGTSYFEVFDNSPTQTVLQKISASGISLIDINARPSDGSSSAIVRVFRTTNTTGARRVELLRGDGSGTIDIQLSTGGGNSYFNSPGARVGIGTTIPTAALDVVNSTGGQIKANDWIDMASNQSGRGFIGGNFYTDAGGGNVLRYSRTHPSIGGVGVGFNHPSLGDVSIITSPVRAATQDVSFTPTTIAVFRDSGDVGIGTTSPSERLHVAGSGIITGDLNVQGTTIIFDNLPTASGALQPGELWVDIAADHTLKITPA